MGRCWGLWGAGPPQAFRWAISRAFLRGVCMFSPCSQGVSSTKNPNRKTCKKNSTLLSVPDRDGRFTGSPGAEKLPTDPGGGTIRDGLKAEVEFTATSGLHVRVCPVSLTYITRVCSSVVCANRLK